MAIEMPEHARSSAFFRLLDAKDIAALRGQLSEEPQATDEITRGWLRGQTALEAYFVETLPRITEIHSRLEEPEVRRWGDVEVETFVLRQSYVYDATRYEVEAPTTMIWRRERDEWKLALMHSIPLPPAS